MTNADRILKENFLIPDKSFNIIWEARNAYYSSDESRKQAFSPAEAADGINKIVEYILTLVYIDGSRSDPEVFRV